MTTLHIDDTGDGSPVITVAQMPDAEFAALAPARRHLWQPKVWVSPAPISCDSWRYRHMGAIALGAAFAIVLTAIALAGIALVAVVR